MDQPGKEAKKEKRSTSIGRDDDELFGRDVLVVDVLEHLSFGEEIVDGSLVEEALDLSTVKIDGNQTMGSHRFDELGDDRGRDGNSWLRFSAFTKQPK